MVQIRRLLGQKIRIGNEVIVTFTDYHNGIATIRVDSPSSVSVLEEEDWRALQSFYSCYSSEGHH